LELIRPEPGELLWSFVKESRAGYDLRDPASVESLISEAFQDFIKTKSQEKHSGCTDAACASSCEAARGVNCE